MEKQPKKLACDDRRINCADYCLRVYRESVKNGTYSKEIPDFLLSPEKRKKKKQNKN